MVTSSTSPSSSPSWLQQVGCIVLVLSVHAAVIQASHNNNNIFSPQFHQVESSTGNENPSLQQRQPIVLSKTSPSTGKDVKDSFDYVDLGIRFDLLPSHDKKSMDTKNPLETHQHKLGSQPTTWQHQVTPKITEELLSNQSLEDMFRVNQLHQNHQSSMQSRNKKTMTGDSSFDVLFEQNAMAENNMDSNSKTNMMDQKINKKGENLESYLPVSIQAYAETHQTFPILVFPNNKAGQSSINRCFDLATKTYAASKKPEPNWIEFYYGCQFALARPIHAYKQNPSIHTSPNPETLETSYCDRLFQLSSNAFVACKQGFIMIKMKQAIFFDNADALRI